MLITGQNKVSNLSRPFPLPTASCRLFLLQQMFQIFVISDAFQLFLNNLFHLLLDAPVIRLHCFLHAVFAILVREVGNDGYRLVGFLLALHLLGIHDNLAVENLLLDALVEVVGHRTDEHPLRQAGNLARRDKRVHLRVDGGGNILPVDGNGLPLLKYLAKAFGERLGGFSHDLTGEDIADGIHHDLRLFVPIVTHQLAEILKAQTHGNLVASRGGDKVVQPLEINCRQLVNDDRRLQHPFLVDELHNAGVIQTESRTINILTVGIIAHAKYIRLFRIVDVQRELAVRHHPIKLRGNHP